VPRLDRSGWDEGEVAPANGEEGGDGLGEYCGRLGEGVTESSGGWWARVGRGRPGFAAKPCSLAIFRTALVVEALNAVLALFLSVAKIFSCALVLARCAR